MPPRRRMKKRSMPWRVSMWLLRFIQKKIGGAMRCLTTTAFPSRAQIQEAPFTKIGRNTVQSTFMRTSLLLAYKSVRTLRRAGWTTPPRPARVTVSWWRPRRETRPFSLRLPPPSLGRPAPEVRQDFACHTSGWPRAIRRGLLAAPRDLGGAARWRRQFGEGWREKWRRGIWIFACSSEPCPPDSPCVFGWCCWLSLSSQMGLKIEQEGQQKSLAGHPWAGSEFT